MAIIIPASLLFDEDGNDEVLEAGDEQQIQDENDSGDEISEDEALEIIAEAAEDMTEEDVQALSEEEIQEGFDFLELSEEEIGELEGESRQFTAKNPVDEKGMRWITIGGRRIPIKANAKNSVFFPVGGYVGDGKGGQRWLGRKEARANRTKLAAGMGVLGAGLAAAYALKKGRMPGEALKKGIAGLKGFGARVGRATKTDIGNLAARGEFMAKYGMSKAKGAGREMLRGAKLKGQDIAAGARNIGKNIQAGANVIGAGAKNLGKKVVPGAKDLGKKAWNKAVSIRHGVRADKPIPEFNYSEENSIIIPYSSLMLSDMFSGEQIDDIVLSALHALAPGVNFSEDKPWEHVEIEQDENGEICSVAFGENYIDAEGMKAIGFSLMDNAGSYQFAFNKKQFEPIGNEGEENEMPDDEELEQEPAPFKKKKKRMMMMKGEMNKEGQEEMELCGSKKMKMKK